MTDKIVELNRAEKLAADHWEYIEALLKQHGTGLPESEKMIKLVGFHYKTAFKHGYKHGVEDEKDK